MSDEIRLAVLIDADNTTPRLTREMFDELARFGPLTVKRAYGDWTGTRLGGWKDQLLAHAISPMQQFAYTTGKNSTDSALIIDAMDLLYADNVEGFVIVSSDSDFTRLATRLRESGKTVYGVGQRKTPRPFQDACDQFIFLELLGVDPAGASEEVQEAVAQTQGDDASAVPAQETLANLQSMLTKALNKTGDDDGWSRVSTIGSHLTRTSPSFDSRAYGFGKLGDLVQGQPYLETRTTTTAAGGDQLWARLKGHKPAQKPAQKTTQKTVKKAAAKTTAPKTAPKTAPEATEAPPAAPEPEQDTAAPAATKKATTRKAVRKTTRMPPQDSGGV